MTDEQECSHERVRLAEWNEKHEDGAIECRNCGAWGSFMVEDWYLDEDEES